MENRMNTENTICIQTNEREFVFPLSTTFLEVRRRIAEEVFQIPNGYVELTNNSPRIYKDYGKFFFDYGIIPSTFDYYLLSDITIGGRTFIFHASLENIPSIGLKREMSFDSSVGLSSSTSTGLYHDRFKNKKPKKENSESESFVYNEDDFPSLS